MNIINTIKINMLNKKNKIIINYNKKNINILKILLKLNIIKFIIKKNKKIIIIINFLKKNKTIFKLKNLYKNSNYKIIRFKNLKKINNNNCLFIISTNKGVILNYDSIKKKIGGVLLTYI